MLLKKLEIFLVRTYLEPNRASAKNFFAKIVNSLYPLTVSTKKIFIDV